MRAFERLFGTDGKEVMLFPLEYMNISQDEGGSYSHAGTLNMDFLGWGASGRVYDCPYYAPCSMRLVAQSQASAYNIWQSLDVVHTPLGLIHVTVWVMHDNNLPFNVGDTITQGELLGHTGNAGQSAGDHVHINTASGTYIGQEQVPPDNNWELINSRHIYDIMYVNDTIIVDGAGHKWLEYQGGIDPSQNKKPKKFKWVLYANILRNKDI